MKSDIIKIDNRENGFTEAVEETRKVATYKNLDPRNALRLQMLTEEMLSLTRSITGEMEASFWIEFDGNQAELHMTTNTILDRKERQQLLDTATSRKNEASKTFLGKLRDIFEEVRAADPKKFVPNDDLLADLPHGIFEEAEWDGYERSILRKLADDIKMSIRGNLVEMTVSKCFS